MAKKKPAKSEETPADKKAKLASQGVKTRLDERDDTLTYNPNETERKTLKYVKRRVQEMQDFRKGLGIENRWREADEEYIPHELDFGTTRKRFETDQDTGLRSRMVPVGDITQQWRQASSAPTLLAKLQTAVGLLIDQQPEAELTALVKKYSTTTDIAYALWKRNWTITDAKEKLKVIVFDLIKYGWTPQRTYPRKVIFDKRILVSADVDNPENDKYEDRKVEWFNDVDRQPLSVFKTWIDELSRPYDPYSTNEAYYELDYSYDTAALEFQQYPNWKYVKRDSQYARHEEKRKSNRTETNTESMSRKDVVTIGFFESRTKDLFVITIPKDGIVLYVCPMPNDDGYLSITHTLWLLRRSNLPYGVSLWEIIRQNKALYDKMKNMTMDQLVLSIMKFGFFSGTNTAVGDGKMEIIPGQARQLTSSTGKPEINWMDIPGPGDEAWRGLEAVQSMMDDESGISPTLEGEVTGKTLGEVMHAKEAGLKRLKTPLENIAWLIEQDAYVTLSWMSQVYALPTVKDFTSTADLMAYQKESGLTPTQLFGTQNEDGSLTGPYQAHFLPELALHLEDREGRLTESKKSNFLQVGKDIKIHQLKWRGIFKVRPRSLIDTSQTIVKATKMEMFNLLVPLLQFPAEIAAKAAQQICKVNEEDYEDWLPDSWVTFLKNGGNPPMPGLPGPGAPPTAQPGPGMPPGAPPQGGMPPTGSMQGAGGMAPQQAPTVVPRGQVSGPTPAQTGGGAAMGGLFQRRL